jgi:hypothetical protein
VPLKQSRRTMFQEQVTIESRNNIGHEYVGEERQKGRVGRLDGETHRVMSFVTALVGQDVRIIR